MLGFLLLSSIICCIVVYGDVSKDGELVIKYKWMLLMPVAVVILATISLVITVENTIPEGESITRLVRVTNEDTGDSYYWNLVISVWKDAVQDDNAISEYDAYEVVGYLSPETGKRVEVEPYSSEKIGDVAYFYEYYNNGEDENRYNTTINKADIEVSFIEKISKTKISSYVFYVLYLMLGFYTGIKVVRFWSVFMKMHD